MQNLDMRNYRNKIVENTWNLKIQESNARKREEKLLLNYIAGRLVLDLSNCNILNVEGYKSYVNPEENSKYNVPHSLDYINELFRSPQNLPKLLNPLYIRAVNNISLRPIVVPFCYYDSGQFSDTLAVVTPYTRKYDLSEEWARFLEDENIGFKYTEQFYKSCTIVALQALMMASHERELKITDLKDPKDIVSSAIISTLPSCGISNEKVDTFGNRSKNLRDVIMSVFPGSTRNKINVDDLWENVSNHFDQIKTLFT